MCFVYMFRFIEDHIIIAEIKIQPFLEYFHLHCLMAIRRDFLLRFMYQYYIFLLSRPMPTLHLRCSDGCSKPSENEELM